MARKISRRDFIRGAAAGGAAVGLLGSQAFAAQEDVMTVAEYTGKKWAFEIPPAPVTQVQEQFEGDVVVVGAGISGLCTANTAAEAGLKVLLVSASQAPVSRGGSNNAVYSKAMEAAGVARVEPKYIEKEIFYASNNVDTKKWYKYYNNSEEAMNWAIDLMAEAGYGCGIEVTTPMDPDSLFYIPASSHGWLSEDIRSVALTQPFFAKELADRLVRLGGEIFFGTRGLQLIRGGAANGQEGRVSGVIAERPDGSFAQFNGAKAVVLATGDFSADRELMHRYCPTFADVISDETYDAEPNYDAGFQYGGLYKGDGQKMGLWVGAAWQRVFPNCPMGGLMTPGPNKAYSTHFGLMVDRNGERFINEYSVSPVAGVSAALLDGGEAYAIWDTAYARHTGCWLAGLSGGPMGEEAPEPGFEEIIAAWDAGVQDGMYVKGDSLEEVVEKLGLPPKTLETIERYNGMARNGEDTEFHKRPDMLHEIKEGPFYGHKSDTRTVLTVLGGLRTNVNMQVCDKTDNPIPGLYNVGTMVGDMFSTNYSFMTCGANYGANCITFGYLTGRYIAENE